MGKQAGVRPPCKGDSLEFSCERVLKEFKVSYATS